MNFQREHIYAIFVFLNLLICLGVDCIGNNKHQINHANI
jgi:hypothetical protein